MAQLAHRTTPGIVRLRIRRTTRTISPGGVHPCITPTARRTLVTPDRVGGRARGSTVGEL